MNLRDNATGQDLHRFAAPFTLTYTPTASELESAGGDLVRIGMALWNGEAWVPQVCSLSGGSLVCSAPHLSVFAVLISPRSDAVLDWDVPGGHIFKQANGFSGAGALGYSVLDDDQAAFWTEFQRLGGVPVVGYPVSTRFKHAGYLTQAFQKQSLQWRPELLMAVPVNMFDDLNQQGADAWLDSMRQTPPAADTSADAGLTFEQVVARHINLLDPYPPLRDFYLAQPAAIDQYGLPLAVKDYGSLVAVRLQRATLQLWKQDTPWAAAGSVVVGNGGDIGKEAGLWPVEAIAPQTANALADRLPADRGMANQQVVERAVETAAQQAGSI